MGDAEQTTEQPKDAGAAPAEAQAPAIVLLGAAEVDAGRLSKIGQALLLKACDVFGLQTDADMVTMIQNPNDSSRFERVKDVAAFRFVPSPDQAIEPDAIIVVTSGGVKLKYYADDSVDGPTQDTLRRLFHAFHRDDKGNVVADPLPDNWTLPREAVIGISNAKDHVYQKGYLREGGKVEAAKRASKAKPKDEPPPAGDGTGRAKRGGGAKTTSK